MLKEFSGPLYHTAVRLVTWRPGVRSSFFADLSATLVILLPASKIKSTVQRLTPTNIQQIGEELAIVWNDGAESYLPLEMLRRACPCAGCGGEPDVLGNLARPEVTYTPESFMLRSCQNVGGYALQPTWADGHGTGLYTFPYLRRLAGSVTPPP